MKAFWKSLAKAAVKVAVYAAGHPDIVIGLVQQGKARNIGGVEDVIEKGISGGRQ